MSSITHPTPHSYTDPNKSYQDYQQQQQQPLQPTSGGPNVPQGLDVGPAGHTPVPQHAGHPNAPTAATTTTVPPQRSGAGGEYGTYEQGMHQQGTLQQGTQQQGAYQQGAHHHGAHQHGTHGHFAHDRGREGGDVVLTITSPDPKTVYVTGAGEGYTMTTSLENFHEMITIRRGVPSDLTGSMAGQSGTYGAGDNMGSTVGQPGAHGTGAMGSMVGQPGAHGTGGNFGSKVGQPGGYGAGDNMGSANTTTGSTGMTGTTGPTNTYGSGGNVGSTAGSYGAGDNMGSTGATGATGPTNTYGTTGMTGGIGYPHTQGGITGKMDPTSRTLGQPGMASATGHMGPANTSGTTGMGQANVMPGKTPMTGTTGSMDPTDRTADTSAMTGTTGPANVLQGKTGMTGATGMTGPANTATDTAYGRHGATTGVTGTGAGTNDMSQGTDNEPFVAQVEVHTLRATKISVKGGPQIKLKDWLGGKGSHVHSFEEEGVTYEWRKAFDGLSRNHELFTTDGPDTRIAWSHETHKPGTTKAQAEAGVSGVSPNPTNATLTLSQRAVPIMDTVVTTFLLVDREAMHATAH